MKTTKPSKGTTFAFFGTDWTLLRRRSRPGTKLGGEVDFGLQTITINTKYAEEQFLDYLMHELLEAAGLCSGSHYEKTFPGTDAVYILTHDRLDMMAGQIRHAYDAIKETL